MVSLEIVQQSNARIPTLSQDLVVLLIGATSGYRSSCAPQNFAQHASSARIYTVARLPTMYFITRELANKTTPILSETVTYHLIAADDVSLLSEVDKVVKTIIEKGTSLDLLFMYAGFIPFEGRKNTREGLEPSMKTRFYSRLRVVEQLFQMSPSGVLDL